MRLISASTIVVQCAAVSSDWRMCSPICRRMRDRGVGCPLSAVGWGSGASRYGDSVCSGASACPFSRKARTSFFVTRPRRPLPFSSERSTLCSAAIRRTTGEIGGGCSSPADSRPPTADSSLWASPGRAPVSIRASTVPTSTVLPTSTRTSSTRPEAGDGTSVSTLSVEISTMVSSASTQSPTRFFHSTTVPSATETPIWGIVTSATLVIEELTACLLHVADLGQHGALERRAEGHRRVRRRDAHDRSVEVLEGLLGDQRRHLRADSAGARGLVQDHHLARLAHRGEDRVHVERHQRAQIDHLHRVAAEVVGVL